jgi:DNA-binding transcriptional LysR family regulator
MDFEQVRIFMVLVQEKTFLGAAKRLGTSRSRIRRKLDQLEGATGTALLHRESGSLALTPAGEVLARRARSLLMDAEVLVSRVREVGTSPAGRLPIALPLGPPSALCLEACSVLQTRYPHLEIEVFFDARPTRLLPKRAEIAITYEANLDRGLEVTELNEIPMRLFAGPRYIERHGRPENPDDLSLNRLACWQHDDASRTSLLLSGGRSRAVSPRVLSEDPTFLCQLAVESDYLAYAPDLPALRHPSLSTLLVEEIRGAVRERLVVPEVLADLPSVQAFAEFCQTAKAAEPTVSDPESAGA